MSKQTLVISTLTLLICTLTRWGAAYCKIGFSIQCLTTRTEHIEVDEEMTFPSFINAILGFIANCEPVQAL